MNTEIFNMNGDTITLLYISPYHLKHQGRRGSFKLYNLKIENNEKSIGIDLGTTNSVII